MQVKNRNSTFEDKITASSNIMADPIGIIDGTEKVLLQTKSFIEAHGRQQLKNGQRKVAYGNVTYLPDIELGR